MTRIPGNRFLHSPGPTHVPDEVLNAMHRQPMDHGDPRLDQVIAAIDKGVKQLLQTKDAELYMYASNGHGVWGGGDREPPRSRANGPHSRHGAFLRVVGDTGRSIGAPRDPHAVPRGLSRRPQCFEIILVNAHHIKHVPGRKTDKKDSAWIAQLLLSGLLKGSFIPPRPLRELRDLFRYRKKLKSQTVGEKNRAQKILEDANIKTGNVISDMFGVSGKRIFQAIIAGETNAEKLADLAHGTLQKKRKALVESLKGNITAHHRFMLQTIFKSLQQIETLISEVETETDLRLKEYQIEVQLLQTIPGVGKQTAGIMVAEIGNDMSHFPSQHHLASWAGMCPGNNESAGKKKVPA